MQLAMAIASWNKRPGIYGTEELVSKPSVAVMAGGQLGSEYKELLLLLFPL